MKFPSENGCILDVHNRDGRNFNINYLFDMTNEDSKCRIIKCLSRIKEGVLIVKKFGPILQKCVVKSRVSY